jgi:hypothetical protein
MSHQVASLGLQTLRIFFISVDNLCLVFSKQNCHWLDSTLGTSVRTDVAIQLHCQVKAFKSPWNGHMAPDIKCVFLLSL